MSESEIDESLLEDKHMSPNRMRGSVRLMSKSFAFDVAQQGLFGAFKSIKQFN